MTSDNSVTCPLTIYLEHKNVLGLLTCNRVCHIPRSAGSIGGADLSFQALSGSNQTRVLHPGQHSPSNRPPRPARAPHRPRDRLPHHSQLPPIQGSTVGHLVRITASNHHGKHPGEGRLALQTCHCIPCQTQDSAVHQT